MKSGHWLIGTAAALVALAASSAQALVIGFSPSSQSHVVGSNASVDIVISGLSASNQVVSGFDIDIGFTGGPNVTFVSGTYSEALGIVDSETFSFAPTATGGIVELFSLSFLDDADLANIQADSVTLATLTFHSNAALTSALSISYNLDTDITGFEDPGNPNVVATGLNPDPSGGQIRWFPRTGQPASIPGTLLLLGAPLFWMMRRVARQ